MKAPMRILAALATALPAISAERAVIPQPASVVTAAGSFTLMPQARIASPPAARAEAEFLAGRLRRSTGYRLPVESDPAGAAIVLRLESGLERLGPEGYRLVVTPARVELAAPARAGLFYGIQTLRQLFPVAVEQETPVAGVAWQVPALTIEDQPRFRWRGAMLDVCRHLLSADEIKTFIDLMALHKLNTLQLHLTDDQGWRIEIKKYPKLTEVGAWRAESPKHGQRNQGDGKRYGGFLTQAQLQDIVAHATARHITVVPEIEMPGHGLAALSAYPELGCTGGPYQPRTRWGVEPDVFCAGNPKTFAFLEDVLTEVLAIFPSTFIHVGGDECPKDRWNKCPKCQGVMKEKGLKDAHALQSHFIQHFDRWLAARERRLIGWDEILEGGLAPGAAVMSWRGVKGGIAAAKSGHDVVMSPTSHLYLDYAQSKAPSEPESIGGLVTLRQVYSYDPVPAGFTPAEASRVLGAQGNLWSEYLYDFRKVQYFAFPRVCALAEVVWSPQSARSYDEFLTRLPSMLTRLDALQVNYRKVDDFPAAGGWASGEVTDEWSERTWPLPALTGKPGLFEVRFQYTGGTHRLDIEWAALLADGREIARDAHRATTGARDENNRYRLRLPAGTAGAIALKARVRADGGADSNGQIFVTRQGD